MVVIAQVTVADVASILAVPSCSSRVGPPTRPGGLLVAGCALVVFLVADPAPTALGPPTAKALKQRGWALDLRLSLAVLFGLAWLRRRAAPARSR
jgi:hypothetical protein